MIVHCGGVGSEHENSTDNENKEIVFDINLHVVNRFVTTQPPLPFYSHSYVDCVCVCVCVTREEIGSLESKVEKAKESFLQTVDEASESSAATVAMLPAFEVNDRFLLNQDEAWYTLSIEIQVPLDVVLLQV